MTDNVRVGAALPLIESLAAMLLKGETTCTLDQEGEKIRQCEGEKYTMRISGVKRTRGNID